MPFAQVHYPFENAEWFESHYPGDFIVEYMAQTRGWFYTLHVLATALFDRPSFRTCVVHGIVLGDDGQKMSKSLNNYPDPMMVFDTYGADAMRWYLLSSTILRGGDCLSPRTASARACDTSCCRSGTRTRSSPCTPTRPATRRGVRTESTIRSTSTSSASLRDLVADVTDTMDAYDLFARLRHGAHVPRRADQLVRAPLPRQRFWAGDPEALDVLWTVLDVVPGRLAPLLPLDSEAVYRGLHGGAGVTDGAQRAPHRLADGRRVPAIRRARSHDGPRPRCVQGRVGGPQGDRTPGPAAAGSVTIAAPDAESLRDVRRHHRRRDQRAQTSCCRPTSTRSADRTCSSCRACSVRASARTCRRSSRHTRPATGRIVDGVVTVGGLVLVDGEYRLRLVASDDRASDGLANDRVSSCSTSRSRPNSSGRGPPAIWSGSSSRRAATPVSSVRSRRLVDRRRARSGSTAATAHRTMVMDETLARELDLEVSAADGGAPVITVHRVG